MSDLKRSPLHEMHAARGARFVPFAGWEMPVQYGGIKEEHLAVRRNAGLFDVSHMGEFRVEGPEAVSFLNRVATNDVKRLQERQGLYTPLCAEAGGVIDDIIVYRLKPEGFLAVVNAANREKDLAWMRSTAEAFDCEVIDETERWALLALQGPRAETIFAAATNELVSELKRFRIASFEVAGVGLMAARTGYTGEDGFEVFIPAAEATAVATALEEAGRDSGLCWAGLGCRDSLRLEAGYPLYGHEISGEIDPLTGGIGWTVKWRKPDDFIGRQALETLRKAGPARGIAYFVVEDRRMARTGMEVFTTEGSRVGTVVSAAFSPVLEAPIGAALLDGSALQAEDLYVESRGHRMRLQLKKPPLHH